MCGICGAIGLGPTETAELAVRRMLAAIVHRGPDDEGFLSAGSVVAGSRRLSIIDLPGGGQPLWNEAETLAVFFNGEIYNFRELRDDLQRRGHTFRTNSDTEVIVHAYEEWGEESPARLRGMFAFAVLEMPGGANAPVKSVFLARDPLGIKPLYYARAGSGFLFSSEVRSLLASRHVAAELAPESVSAYLLFGSVCEPATMVEGVFSLLPGYSVKIQLDRSISDFTPKRYWNFAAHPAKKAADGRPDSRSRSSCAAEVRSLLEDSVRGHLIADVPVGVFLSSGVDSTALAALAARMQGGVHTFTVSFPDIQFSEAEIARRTAKRLGTEHRDLSLSSSEMESRLDEAIAAFDQPSMDGINSYFVSWAARQAGLKVALSGLGSDELFGGYASFRATARMAQIANGARFVPRGLREWSANFLKKSKAYGGSRDAFRKAAAGWLDPEALPHPYFFSRALFAPQVVAAQLRQNPSSWKSTSWSGWLCEAAREAEEMDGFTQVSWLELRSYLLNTLLRDTDGMSMAHSLEVRVPFLDTPLVEHVLNLPEAVKSETGRPKSLLVDALAELLPEEIVNQKKRTFTFPWENWMRGPLGQRVASGLRDWSPALASVLDAKFAQGIFEDFQRAETTWSRPWSLYVLNEWVKRNLSTPQASSGESRLPAVQTSER